MEMASIGLKYQWLIDREQISLCPQDCIEMDIIGYRWVFSDINHKDNFLPKILLDEKNGTPPRKNSITDPDKCSYCGLSMFNTLEAAINKFMGFPMHIRKKLGYTHVASGSITSAMGVVTQISNNGHFDLFEYEGIDLSQSFTINGELAWNN